MKPCFSSMSHSFQWELSILFSPKNRKWNLKFIVWNEKRKMEKCIEIEIKMNHKRVRKGEEYHIIRTVISYHIISYHSQYHYECLSLCVKIINNNHKPSLYTVDLVFMFISEKFHMRLLLFSLFSFFNTYVSCNRVYTYVLYLLP